MKILTLTCGLLYVTPVESEILQLFKKNQCFGKTSFSTGWISRNKSFSGTLFKNLFLILSFCWSYYYQCRYRFQEFNKGFFYWTVLLKYRNVDKKPIKITNFREKWSFQKITLFFNFIFWNETYFLLIFQFSVFLEYFSLRKINLVSIVFEIFTSKLKYFCKLFLKCMYFDLPSVKFTSC